VKRHEKYQRLLDLCKSLSPTPTAIASPCAAASLNRAVAAAQLELLATVLVGFGMALGLLLGAIPIALPDLGKLVLGLAGVLIVTLVLGKLWRTRGVNWTVPLSANFVLRNLGSRCFLPGRNIFGANVRDNSDADGFGDAESRRGAGCAAIADNDHGVSEH
jgi:predicted permease membrane protein